MFFFLFFFATGSATGTGASMTCMKKQFVCTMEYLMNVGTQFGWHGGAVASTVTSDS